MINAFVVYVELCIQAVQCLLYHIHDKDNILL